MSKLVLTNRSNPGALGANLTAIFVSLTGKPSYVGNDGVEHEIGTVGGGTPTFSFAIDTGSTADSDPGDGLIKFNNATQANATQLYVDNLTSGGANLTTFYASLPQAGFVHLVSDANASVWRIYKITAVTSASGYYKLTVTNQAGQNSFSDADPISVLFLPNPSAGNASLSYPYSANVTDVAEPQFEIYADNGSTQPGYAATAYSTTNGLNGGTYHCRAARGSRASPTALLKGDLIGGYGARWCHSTGNFHTSSPVSIHPQVTENQTSGAWGSWWRFLTTPKGSTTRQERGGITDNGTFWSHDTFAWDATLDRVTLPVADAKFVASGDASTGSGASYAAAGYGTDCAPGFRGLKAGGSGASPSAVVGGQLMCFMGGHGHDGTNFSTGTKAILGFYAFNTWSGSDNSCYVEIGTTPSGSTTRTARVRVPEDGGIAIQDGITAPATLSGWAKIYVDSADGDLKVKFGDGTVKTIVVDT